jgi:hypothetical protein
VVEKWPKIEPGEGTFRRPGKLGEQLMALLKNEYVYSKCRFWGKN